MVAPNNSNEETEKLSLKVRFARAFRRYFFTGLATLFPVTVTLFVVWKIFGLADGLLGKFLPFQFPGLGLILTVVIILLVGVFSVHFFGKVIFRIIEIWLERLPFVRKIFPPIKQLTQFLFEERTRRSSFRRAVLVEYPRIGTYTLGFVTNELDLIVKGAMRKFVTVLIPQPPSPFTGPIIFIPADEMIPLDITIEDAVKLIMSGGVVAPPLKVVSS